MKTRVVSSGIFAAAVLLGACGRQEQVREIDWAKAALARNPAFEIMTTDEISGEFTVRDTATGVVHTVKFNELIAAPLPAKPVAATTATPRADAMAQPAPTSEPVVEPVEPVEPIEPVALAAGQTTSTGDLVIEGPGYSISRGSEAAPPAAAARGRSSLEGPGYSITRPEGNAAPSVPEAEARAGNIERRVDPIICQGERLMRIDGETLEFTGDALIAEHGCDLYISNARIRAGGVGIIARGQARVHIVNSTIGGSRGSYEASQGAEIYVARSTFAGIGRRFDTATMNDLGGNEFELNH